MVDAAPEAEYYCTDGYQGYLDVIYPGKHIYNIHNKNDTFTVKGVNADLRHYIPTLARRSRCFPRKLENLQAVLAVLFRPTTVSDCRKNAIALVIQGLLSLFPSLTSFNSAFGHSRFRQTIDFTGRSGTIDSIRQISGRRDWPPGREASLCKFIGTATVFPC